MRRLVIGILCALLLSSAANAAIVFQVPNGPADNVTGALGPGSGDCRCQLTSVLAMDNITTIRFYVGATGGSAGVEEVGVYSYDGNTKYFDDADDFDSQTVGYEVVTNDLGTTALPQGSVWVCFSADASTTQYNLAMSSSVAEEELATYQATVTCTSGNLPATISPSGAYTANGTWAIAFTNF